VKIFVAISLNAALLLLLLPWLRRQAQVPRLGRVLLPTLTLKVLASTFSYLRYTDDSNFSQYWGEQLTAQFWTDPSAWLSTLAGEEFLFGKSHLIYHGFSNTFFLIKLLSALNLASLGSWWLNGVYLTLFSFVGSWQLIRTVGEVFPKAQTGAAVVAWLAWPSVVYWSAGSTKESVLVGSGAWLTALVIGWLYSSGKPIRIGSLMGGLLLALLHFKMRFFFAGLLLAGLASLIVVRVTQHFGGARQRVIQLIIIATVLVSGTRLAAEVIPVLRLNKFTNQLSNNYYQMLRASQQRPHIEYADLKPTLPSIVSYTPQAIINTITRPYIWEDKQFIYVLAGLENIALLILISVALVALIRGRPGHLPFALVVVLVVYCLALAALLGLSTPNLGTLNRYRAVLLPYLVFLLLQNNYAARWLQRLGLGQQ
jgi:hypothetical protein